MKKAVRKGAAKAVALVLSLAMIFGMAPMVNASAGDSAAASASTTTESTFDRIVHLDMGRKYFSPEWIKALINEISALGYTELELDFSNNEGFRFSLPEDQMQIEVGGYETVLMEVEAEETQSPETDAAAAGDTDVTDSALPQASDAAQPEEGTGEADAAQTSEPAGSSEAEPEPQYKEVQVYNSKTVDLAKALSQEYITADQMAEIIDYAQSKDIEIVPLLNSPGHMGAILNAFPEYRWTDNQNRISESTIDLENDEAVRFAQGVVRAYAEWFAAQGCKTFNIGADEFANDLGTEYSPVMGLNYIYYNQPKVYSKLIEYINDLAVIVEKAGMTPRAFNDSFCYNNDTAYAPSIDIQVCYWSPGWLSGYNLAKASTLENQEYQLINTHGDYYYVLGKEDSWDSSDTYRYDFDNNTFAGGSNISDPVGSMFCIWSDYPNDETEQKVAEKVRVPLRIMAARMQDQIVTADTVDTSVTPGGFNADGTINVPAASVTDETTNITVSADEVTSISVVKYEEAIPALADSTYVAYDISLNGGNYTQSAQVSIPLPEGWNYSDVQLSGFVLSSDGEVEYATDGSLNDGVYTFTAPHFSTVGVVARTGDIKYVTVSVGGTAEYELSGEQTVSSNEDPNVASVNAQYQEGVGERYLEDVTSIEDIESGAKYLIENQHAGKLLTDEEEVYEKNEWVGYPNWYETFYYDVLKLAGDPDDIDSTEFWTIAYDGGYYTVQNAEAQYLKIGGSSAEITSEVQNLSLEYKTFTQNRRTYSGWYIGQGTEYLNDFEGNGVRAAGYNATEDTGSLWNLKKLVETPAEGSTTVTIEGIEVGMTTAVVGNTTYVITVIPEDLSNVTPLTVEFWITNQRVTANGATSMTISATDSGVYSESGVDISSLIPQKGTSSGNEMDYWKTTRLDRNHRQTSDSGVDQTKAGIDFHYIRYWDGKWSYSVDGHEWENVASGDQIVAYYLQRTDVTKEVVTQVVDWGPKRENWGDLDYLGTQYVLLDYTVKYEDGTENPSSFPTEDSLGFHCENVQYRTLGMVRALETADYEVYMITLTPTEDAQRNTLSGRTAAGNSRYSYNGTEVIAWAASQDIIDNSELGTYKSISGAFECEVGGDPIVSGLEIYSRHGMKVTYYVRAKVTEDSLSVHYIDETSGSQTEFYNYNIAVISGTVFDPGFALQNGSLVNNTVVNKQGSTQTVESDLSKLSEIGAQYKYSEYTCTRAERSADGKEVYLYYSFNNTHSFVVDFGLPVTIQASDLGIQGAPADVRVTGARYGSTEVSGSTVTYTPNKTMDGIETLNYIVTDSTGGTAAHTIYLIPASTVYYEDTFGAIEYGVGWETVGTTITGRAQTTSKLGDKAVYGHDAAYATDTTYSGGSAHKVTLTSGETATASFSFHGTGFQLVSMTDATSGCITVHVEGEETNNYYFVDCYYANGGALYQVPVLKVDDLALGNYTVTVTAGHLSSSDWNGDKESTFVLDGVRIYKPIGVYPNYTQDNEGNVTYSEIRNILLYDGAWDQSNSVYVDTLDASTNSAADYANVGPNNEVYLKAGNQITFTVPEGGSIVQIGAKLVSGKEMTFTVEGQDYEITSAVEMYYLLDGVKPGNEITITASGDGILSLTNLKLVSGS